MYINKNLLAIMESVGEGKFRVRAYHQAWRSKSDQKEDIRAHLERVGFVEVSWDRDEKGNPVALACKQDKQERVDSRPAVSGLPSFEPHEAINVLTTAEFSRLPDEMIHEDRDGRVYCLVNSQETDGTWKLKWGQAYIRGEDGVVRTY